MFQKNITKVLIIGNGFDLAHFLPTSYGDFIAFVQILNNHTGDFSKVSFDEIFLPKTSNQIGFTTEWLESVKRHYETKKMLFDLSSIKSSLNNAWIDYFTPIHTIQTWIDFETEISNALRIVSDFFILVKKIADEGHAVSGLKSFASKELAKDFFHQTKSVRLHRLKLVEGRINERVTGVQVNTIKEVPSEKAVTFKILPICYPKGGESGSLGLNEPQILSYLLQEHDNFIALFAIYLKNVVGKFYEHAQKEQLFAIDSFNEVYSFNYTKTITHLYPTDDNQKIYHLHGDIDSNDGQKIVLGVNDVDTEVLGLSALSFTKYYQTLFKETDSFFLDEPESAAQNMRGVDYFVWGHSLDKSDAKYIKRLFQELSFELAEEKRIAHTQFIKTDLGLRYTHPKSTITIYHHNNAAKASHLKNLLDIIGKELIEKYIYQGFLKFKVAPHVWR